MPRGPIISAFEPCKDLSVWEWEHQGHEWVIQIMACPAWRAAGTQLALSLPFLGEMLLSKLPWTRTVPFFRDLKEKLCIFVDSVQLIFILRWICACVCVYF